ncbi:MAG: hypothetical protein WCC39_06955 [Telluria sp.]
MKTPGRLWKTLWKMENLTGTKVYVSSKHLSIPQVHETIYLLNSVTCQRTLTETEIPHRWDTSVHNCAFPVQNFGAVQQNLDATLEEIA